ncbi:GlxA family transcriptional regulator [Cryptosporangium aurantiacum]|uniref:Transcriptional regulator GlxA family, contains an amidase domain and an AraC-type DNA-binding HTH domain n=1 Tax=Cryptosporangium aurantiacum TaxID=134849 RepID=A0A1M7RBI6_9ACTN|nr:helix-turn-helix domain-containing protein [Cryptosporangium aurantiacum]SHN43499.1 Transcriptional regulator GlxA family, contains an amidase domain and an AraC-type DNA-binding HTH domain [Cryptosporangium aurantiacum]
MHTVAVLALQCVIPFDLAIPVDVFGWTRLPDGSPGYRVLVCGPAGEVDAGTFTIRVRHGLAALADADTIVVPGVADEGAPIPGDVRDALRAAAARGTRIASVCAGAFTLADAGLLDGLRATTHWVGAAELAARYPAIDVDPGVLFVDNGQILTSAGAAAGLDLCLHLVRRDYGSAVAADAARFSVTPLERDGGQAQFIAHEPPAPDGLSLQPLLAWLEENLGQELTLDRIARQASLSPRTLSRRFREQTGTTPQQWLTRVRLRRAQHLLETTGHPVERIAAQTGFPSPSTFRDRFKRLVGVSPAAYRSKFRATPAA